MDITGYTEKKISPTDRENWREWIWAQYAGKPPLCFLANASVSPPFYRRRISLGHVDERRGSGKCACVQMAGDSIDMQVHL
jgi:hypothetical protein